MHRFCHIAVLALCLTTALTSLTCMVQAQQTSPGNDLEYTIEQIQSTTAQTFLERMAKPEPGYQQFAALHALGRKAKESDSETRRGILDLVVWAMNDKTRTEYQRFQCCYVISDSGDERGVPYLADVLRTDPSATMRSVAAEALGYFKNSTAALDALLKAAQLEKDPKVLDVINRRLNQGNANYTPEQIKSTPAETFLARMKQAEAGYGTFAAMHALGKKAKDSNASDRWTILSMVVKAMNDKTRTEYQRFQCCYVISDCGDEQWVPCLVNVLMKDPSVTMRSVAAEALGLFRNCAAARAALLQAALRETDQKVLDVISRVLGRMPSTS